MRILITSVGAIGHVLPVVPLAQSLVAAGHEVRWATGTDGCRIVDAAGLTAMPAGITTEERQAAFFTRYPEAADIAPQDLPEFMFPRLFGAVAAPPMVADLLAIVDGWPPDVIVHEAAELAAPIVAGRIGVRNVTMGFGALLPPVRTAAASEVVAPLWQEYGLEPRPWSGCYDHLYLDIFPPSLQPAYGDHVTRREPMRPVAFSGEELEPWAPPAGDAPLVYITFGTVFNATDGGFQAAVDALASMDVRVLVTVGPQGDPLALGPQPANVTVARYVPQTSVLPACSLVVAHAGSGTFLASLALGIPLLCLPRAADQFTNAQQCANSGAGLQLLPHEVTVDSVRAAATRLLTDPSFAAGARRIAAEIEQMPHPTEVVPSIEAFGR